MMATHWQAACENGPQLPHGNCSQSQREGEVDAKGEKEEGGGRKEKEKVVPDKSTVSPRIDPFQARNREDELVALNSC